MDALRGLRISLSKRTGTESEDDAAAAADGGDMVSICARLSDDLVRPMRSRLPVRAEKPVSGLVLTVVVLPPLLPCLLELVLL